MDEKCGICYGTGIEDAKVEMSDGYGGYEYITEPKPCCNRG